jgi:hypothetical protein
MNANWEVFAASDFVRVEAWTDRGLVIHYRGMLNYYYYLAAA